MGGSMTTLFEAVVFRFVPDEGAGESLNVGLAMRTESGFFRVKLLESWKRITDAFPMAHGPTLRATFIKVRDSLNALDTGVALVPGVSDLGVELKRLVPSPDGYLKWSETIEGETDDPPATFDRLLYRYVEQNLRAKPERVSRTDEDVKDTFSRALAKRAKLKTKLFPKQLVAKGKTQWRVEVEHAWKNGVWNCVQPVSLDLIDPNQITAKAAEVAAKVRVVTPSALGAHVVLYVGLPPQSRPEALSAAQEAIDGVRQLVDNEAEVVLEEESEQLLDRIERDVSAPLH